MIDEFLKLIMAKANTVMTVYYEEAPTNATFPYGVMTTFTVTPLDYGYNCIFDIELNTSELSDTDLDAQCDNLRVALDGYRARNSVCGFHVGYDSQLLSRQTEQDLTMRRITFSARIF